MVSRLIPALLVCLICSGQVAAGQLLAVKVDKKSSVLGEPLLLEIKAEDMRAHLDSMSLDRLKQDFNVYGINSSTQTHKKHGRTVTIETMALTLYPLRSGKLRLPVLHFQGSSSKPVEITIAESGKNTPRVIFKTAMDMPHLNVRQEATLTLDIYDDGSLQWSAPREVAAKDAHLRKLAESQSEAELDGNRYTLHRYAWALMPLREGPLTVEFPMLDAMKFGSLLRYTVAPVLANAAPVPAYLPVYVPIGKLLLAVEPLPHEIALKRPLEWIFSVQGSGLSIEGLGKLLSSIEGNEFVRFYPLKISKGGGNEQPTTAMQTLQVTIPFVPLRSGALRLPELNIPYFDPATGLVQSAMIPAARVRVYNPLWHTVFMSALGLVLLVAATGSGYWLYRQSQRKLNKRKSLRMISRATNAAELKQALLNFDADSRGVKRHTLQQWLQDFQQHYEVDEQMLEGLQSLQRALYGEAESDIPEADIPALARDAAQLLGKRLVRKCDRQGQGLKSLVQSLFHPAAALAK